MIYYFLERLKQHEMGSVNEILTDRIVSKFPYIPYICIYRHISNVFGK